MAIYDLYPKPSTFCCCFLKKTHHFFSIPQLGTLLILIIFPIYRAIENGANTLAEGFLFAVAAALILGESFRTSRNQSKRRDSVDDQLDELGTKITELSARVDSLTDGREAELREEKTR